MPCPRVQAGPRALCQPPGPWGATTARRNAQSPVSESCAASQRDRCLSLRSKASSIGSPILTVTGAGLSERAERRQPFRRKCSRSTRAKNAPSLVPTSPPAQRQPQRSSSSPTNNAANAAVPAAAPARNKTTDRAEAGFNDLSSKLSASSPCSRTAAHNRRREIRAPKADQRVTSHDHSAKHLSSSTKRSPRRSRLNRTAAGPASSCVLPATSSPPAKP